MSRKTAFQRRNSTIRNSPRSLRPLRAAVEAMEPRVLLSTYIVNTFVDQIDASSSTTVSLRDAIAKAAAHAGADTIDVPAGDYKLTLGELLINDTSGAVTIQGTGGLATINAQSKTLNVIDVGNGKDIVTLNDLNITGATGNEAGAGAIDNIGVLTVNNCSISGNTGNGLDSEQTTGPFVSVKLSGVTISNNSNGIDNAAGLTIINSTISGNTSDGIYTTANFSLFDSTVANNPGIGVYAPTGASVAIGNSVVAGNFPRGDVNAVVVSKGGNVIGNDDAQTAGWVSSDLLGDSANPLDPILAPLGNYGGLTQTMPPVGGSYALAKGVVSAIPAGVTVDQRGMPRVIGGMVDSGAVEIQRPAVIAVSPIAEQQVAGAGMVKFGSFAATGLSGPFVVDVHWGDGTPDTAFDVAAAGTIPAQFHKFAGLGIFETTYAVTDGAGHLSNNAGAMVKVVPGALASIVVNTANDQTDSASSTTVSLRDAITRADQAVGPVDIGFNPTVFATPKTIHLTGNGDGLSLGGNPFGAITITGATAGVTIDCGTSGGLDVPLGATVVLRDLTVTQDSTDYDFLSNEGNLTVVDSTVTKLGQGLSNSGALTLTDSTISGSGSITNSGVATVNNCTITGGSLYGFGNSGTATISDTTITGNYGGIVNEIGAKLTLSNSIVANSVTANIGSVSAPTPDVAGAIKSLGHNLIGNKGGSTGWISSDLIGTVSHPINPKLSPLGSFGGPTQTQYPLAGSPALGAGSTSLIPSGVTTDQRGAKRIVNGKVDIGAFETQSSTVISITPPAAQSAVAGVAKTVSLGSFSDPGGSGPFTVSVEWGDGSPASVLTEKTTGSLGTLSHAFVAVGTLSNTIVVVDQAGDLKSSIFTVTSTPQPLKTITVNTINDVTDASSSTTVSLRDAINRADAAFGPVNIAFSSTVFATAQTIALSSSAVPALNDNIFGLIDFIGPAAGVTVKSHTLYTTNGHGESVPYNNEIMVSSGVVASVSNFTFLQLGFQNYGSITLVDSTITGNTVVGAGGGIANYGGTVKLLDSTISKNTALVDAGPGGSSGGYGGGIENQGTLTIINSTISGNTGGAQGGGIDNQGAAAISDSTISANSSGYGVGDGIDNQAASGSSHPKVTLANSIVAGNTENAGGSDVNGAFTSSGHNLIGKTDGSTGWTGADLTGDIAHPLNANLSALGNNGGPTQTMIPLSGSPALGAGAVSLIPAGVTTDQRGLTRVVSGKVDIGAVEIQKETPYSGTPAPFGLIQAENFDRGGQGAGYYDPGNVNQGGLYRPTEGVGITSIPSTDGGGYAVGYTVPGEYLNYTVTVAATGTYTLNFRVASQPKGGTFHLNVDGKNVTGALSIPSTGSYNTYTIVAKTGVSLTAGTHVLQLVIDTHGTGVGVAGNFDWIQAVKTS